MTKSGLHSNPGLKELEEIGAIFKGEQEVSAHVNYTTVEVQSFQYAPVTSAEVERSYTKSTIFTS